MPLPTRFRDFMEPGLLAISLSFIVSIPILKIMLRRQRVRGEKLCESYRVLKEYLPVCDDDAFY